AFARLPQPFISHHWRRWLRLLSRNSHPHPPPRHSRTRASSWLVSNSAADHATRHSTDSNESRPPHPLHSKLLVPAVDRACDTRTENTRLKFSSRPRSG